MRRLVIEMALDGVLLSESNSRTVPIAEQDQTCFFQADLAVYSPKTNPWLQTAGLGLNIQDDSTTH